MQKNLVTLADASHTDDIEVDGVQLVVEVHHAEDFPVILGELLPHDVQCCCRGGKRDI